MNFPSHVGSMELQHNEFIHSGMDADKWIAHLTDLDGALPAPEWESEEHRERSIKTNEIWTLHWHPETDIRFEYIAAPTFEELLEFASSFSAPHKPA